MERLVEKWRVKGVHSANAYPDRCRTKVEYTHNSVTAATASHSKQRHSHNIVISAKAGIQERQPCIAKQFQKRERACDDTGGTGQYRVEKPLWHDLRLDWIPAFCGNAVVNPNAAVMWIAVGMWNAVGMPSILCVKNVGCVKSTGVLVRRMNRCGRGALGVTHCGIEFLRDG